ncbi:c-type cytochrome [Marinobacter sp. ANT_B65]|uniref:c-type cytochrome n=1 Tax=Marinobacter sp. ANT_B65 TaxID=2039467 RepID=UPI000BBEC8DE|nr:cytochrome C [Marinobacter sp. ANT_B65]PCM43245.1 cytochrome C [Marinobacter sp. ANT_B65]
MNHKGAGGLLIVLLLAVQLLSQAAAAERSAAANYILRCAGCHGTEGRGVASAGIPTFPGYVDEFFNDEEGRLYLMHVPGVVGAGLRNDEISEVMNYVVDRWGKPNVEVEHFTTEEVGRLRQQPVKDVVLLRYSITDRLAKEGVELPEYTWP